MLILKMCLWDIRNILDRSRIIGLQRVIILARGVIIGTRTIMLSLVEIWIQLSEKYRLFKVRMIQKFI
jgi:hypothetical protein